MNCRIGRKCKSSLGSVDSMSHGGSSAAPALLSLKKRDVLRIEKEAVIRTLKLKLITKLADMIGKNTD